MLRYIIAVLATVFFFVFCGGVAHATPQETWKSSDIVLAKSGFTWKTAPRIRPDTELTREDGTTYTLADCGYATVWQCEEAKNALPPTPTADQLKIAQLQGELRKANGLSYYYDKAGVRHPYKAAYEAQSKELSAITEAKDRYMGAVIVLGIITLLMTILVGMFLLNIMQRRSRSIHGDGRFQQGPFESPHSSSTTP